MGVQPTVPSLPQGLVCISKTVQGLQLRDRQHDGHRTASWIQWIPHWAGGNSHGPGDHDQGQSPGTCPVTAGNLQVLHPDQHHLCLLATTLNQKSISTTRNNKWALAPSHAVSGSHAYQDGWNSVTAQYSTWCLTGSLVTELHTELPKNKQI